MTSVVVVIPVYKENLSITQALAIDQCFKVLGRHPITLACPIGFDASNFQSIADSNHKKLAIEEFDSAYFVSLTGYNRLMISSEFYERFNSFESMLIYQNDAYVFSDQLEHWSQSGYDYIGAPWFDGWVNTNGNESIIGAGNGGLSFRNVRKFINILDKIRVIKSQINQVFTVPFLRRIPFVYLSKVLSTLHCLNENDLAELTNFDVVNKQCGEYAHNEDYFWAAVVPKYFKEFSVAKPEVAMFFSFENNPRKLFELTGNCLPFGCHAWEKYDLEFWRQFIDLPHAK